MKKLVTTLLSVTLAIVLGFSLAACEGTKVSVTGVTLSKHEMTLTVGGEEKLTATVTPENATEKQVDWSSSAPAVAKYEDGKVKALSAGNAIITVTTKDGGKKDTCTVKVNAAQSEWYPAPTKAWTEMIDDLAAMENYTAEEIVSVSTGLKYKGEYITNPNKQIANADVKAGAHNLLDSLGLNQKNPYIEETAHVDKCDYVNGRIANIDNPYGFSTTNYVIAEDTAVKEYYFALHDGDDKYNVEKYVGYATKTDAIAAVKNAHPSMIAEMLEEEFTVMDANESVKGTLKDIEEILTYDETTGKYTCEAIIDEELLDSISSAIPEDMDSLFKNIAAKVSVKVENDAITEFKAMMAVEMNMAEMAPTGYAKYYVGISMDVVIEATLKISDVGTTTINPPANIEDNVLYSDYNSVLNEDTYKSMFKNPIGEDGTVSYIVDICNTPDHHYVSYSYWVTFNEELGLLSIGSYTSMFEGQTVYLAKDGTLKTYTYDFSSDGWNMTEESYTGEASEILIEKIPEEVLDPVSIYYNLNGKPMSEQFSMFKARPYTYNDYVANVTLGDEEVELTFNFRLSINKEYLRTYDVGKYKVTMYAGTIRGGRFPEEIAALFPAQD